MKKYPKIVQCDKRGQIVIPKDVRQELGIDEGTGFYMFTITDEGILLKKIPVESLDDNKELVERIANKADKLKINKDNIKKSVDNYKIKKGNLEEI